MRKLPAFAWLLILQAAHAEESLCVHDEVIVFSCHVGTKIVSLCRPSESPRSLTYRYGTPGHLELVYPRCGHEDRGAFYTTSAPLFGGGEATIAFKQAGYEYTLYTKVGRAESGEAERVPVFEDGLMITRKGKVLQKRVCDDGGEGFREDIGWIRNRSDD